MPKKSKALQAFQHFTKYTKTGQRWLKAHNKRVAMQEKRNKKLFGG